jgi:hypothetical protein
MKHLKTFRIFETKVEVDNSFLEVLGKIEDLISYETLKNPYTIIGDFVKRGGNEKDIQKIIDNLANLAKEGDIDTNISKLSAAKEGEKFAKYVVYTKEGQRGKQTMKIARLIKTLFGDKYDEKLVRVFNDMFKLAIDILNGDAEGEEKYMKKD